MRTCMHACDLTPPKLERIKTPGLNMMCISYQGPTMFFGQEIRCLNARLNARPSARDKSGMWHSQVRPRREETPTGSLHVLFKNAIRFTGRGLAIQCVHTYLALLSIGLILCVCVCVHVCVRACVHAQTGIYWYTAWLGRSSSIPEVVDSSPPAVTYFLSTCCDLKPLTVATLMGQHVICNTRPCHCLYLR
jgi:hypothetical protein